MNTSPKNELERVLVVGRSPSVLVATVDILRAKGYSADATNQFDQVLDDYDVTDLDVLVFGGMVPADTKQQLREDISERNPHVTFVQGLAGIAGLIAAQVQAATSAEALDSGEVVYDAAQRSVQLTLNDSAPVTVEATRRGVPHHPTSRSGAVRSVLRRCHRRLVRPRVHRRPHAQCRHAAGTNLGHRQSTFPGQQGHDEQR